MIELESKLHKGKANMHLEDSPEKILEEIQLIVLRQQNEFNRIWEEIIEELQKEKIFLVTEKQLNREQKVFVLRYFEEEVRSNIIPLMIENIPQLPYLRDKSIYLGVVMSSKDNAYKQKYALIEIPSKALGPVCTASLRRRANSISSCWKTLFASTCLPSSPISAMTNLIPGYLK